MSLSPHASRWLVAAVAVPIILLILFAAPPWVFLLLILFVGAMTWWEYITALLAGQGSGLIATCMAGWLAVAAGSFFCGLAGQQIGLLIAMGLTALYFVIRFPVLADVLGPLGRAALGHLYLSFFMSFLLLVFLLPKGPWWILFTLAVTMIGDTSAYYAGRQFGKTPFHPSVSPKKTWEGFFGGLVGAAVSGTIVCLIALPVPWYEAFLAGLLCGAWGAVGDLFESALKRSGGVKDSGALLMGHGGFWDRLDAIAFNVPIVYFFAVLRAGVA